MIRSGRTIIAALYLLGVAAYAEARSDPGPIHRERATGPSLSAGVAGWHLAVNRLPVKTDGTATHGVNARAPQPRPFEYRRFVETVSDLVGSACSQPEKHAFPARPPPAS